jgi:hypothetical protein
MSRADACGPRPPTRRARRRPRPIQEAGNVLGAVLTVSAHRHDPRRTRRHDAGDQGRRLAATPVVAQHADRVVRIAKHPETFGGCVVAAIIDIDQFEWSCGSDRPEDFLSHRGDIVRFVEYSNDNRKAGLARQRSGGCDRLLPIMEIAGGKLFLIRRIGTRAFSGPGKIHRSVSAEAAAMGPDCVETAGDIGGVRFHPGRICFRILKFGGFGGW